MLDWCTQLRSCEWICFHNQTWKGQIKLTNSKFMTEQTYDGHENPIYPVNGLQKTKDIQARLLFDLCETSITSRMVENVCNIILFLIAADWFLPIIASKVFWIWFLRVVV